MSKGHQPGTNAPQAAEGSAKKEHPVIVAIIGGLATLSTAIFGASWFTPKLLRLDFILPTREVSIIDDFVFVHFDGYEEHDTDPQFESYTQPNASSPDAVFDKATYVEYVSLRKTTGNYAINLTTSGIPPEIESISPPLKNIEFKTTSSGIRKMTADLALEDCPESIFGGITPNLKVVYIYRNGFQERHSWGGKDVKYATDRLTFVYDFSLLKDWPKLFQTAPAGCRKNTNEDSPITLDVTWRNGIAFVEAFNLQKDDRVRIFWTWNRLHSGEPSFSPVICSDTLG